MHVTSKKQSLIAARIACHTNREPAPKLPTDVRKKQEAALERIFSYEIWNFSPYCFSLLLNLWQKQCNGVQQNSNGKKWNVAMCHTNVSINNRLCILRWPHKVLLSADAAVWFVSTHACCSREVASWHIPTVKWCTSVHSSLRSS